MSDWSQISKQLCWTSFKCKVCSSLTYAAFRKIVCKEICVLDINSERIVKRTIRTPCVKLRCTCGWGELISITEFEERGGNTMPLDMFNFNKSF